MATPHKTRVLVVDDHEPFRRLVCETLHARPEWQIIGEACDGFAAVQMAKELLPDIVVLDIGMPIMNGIEAAKRIRQASPSSKVIFATQEDDAMIRMEALATGAEAYCLKVRAGRELLPLMDAALGNGDCVADSQS